MFTLKSPNLKAPFSYLNACSVASKVVSLLSSLMQSRRVIIQLPTLLPGWSGHFLLAVQWWGSLMIQKNYKAWWLWRDRWVVGPDCSARWLVSNLRRGTCVGHMLVMGGWGGGRGSLCLEMRLKEQSNLSFIERVKLFSALVLVMNSFH